MVSVHKIRLLSNNPRKGGGCMEILTFLLNNSDAIILSIISCFIYDKIKITLTGNKSDLDKN